MRDQIFEFNQETMIELGISVEEGLLLDYLCYFFNSGNAKKIYINGKMFCWITYKKMLEDLPILKRQERQTRRLLVDLERKGIIERHLENKNRLYIYINQEVLFYGPDGQSWLSYDDLTALRVLPDGQNIPPILKYYKNKIKIICKNARVKDIDKNSFYLKLIQRIKPEISEYAFNKHFKNYEVDSISDRLILLTVPNAREMEDHIKKVFEQTVEDLIKELTADLPAFEGEGVVQNLSQQNT